MDYGDIRLPARFWAKVDDDGPIRNSIVDKCWLWTGYTDKDGYARFHIQTPKGGSRSALAHRWAYMTVKGLDYFKDLKGWDIHHKGCIERYCVRPDHMRETEKMNHVYWHGKMRGYAEVCTGSERCLCWDCCERQEKDSQEVPF